VFAENFFTLGEEFFAESARGDSRQRFLLSAKALFPVVQRRLGELVSLTLE
jgi:hypothetical protein